MFKKVISLLVVVLIASTLSVPAAFASISYEDMEVEFDNDSNLSSSELSRCEHYPFYRSGDEDKEMGFYVCDDDEDSVDLEEVFTTSEIKDIIDDFSEEYDYYPWNYSGSSSRSNYNRSYSRPNYNTAAPAYYPDDTRVCTYQPTADGLGQYLDCTSLHDGDRDSYAYYNDNIFPKLNPRPANYYYGYYY